MANTISVSEKPIADEVSKDAFVLGIQNNESGQPALYRVPIKKVSDKDADNLFFSNALKKTKENQANTSTYGSWLNLEITDANEARADKLICYGYGAQRHTPPVTPSSPQSVIYGSGSVSLSTPSATSQVFSIPNGLHYGVPDVASEYDIISGIGTKKVDLFYIFGDSTDGTWSSQTNDGTKFAYKLVNPDFGMLPAAGGTYGEIVLCNYFESSGRSFYLPGVGVNTVSPIIDSSTTSNLNAFIFTVAATTTYNGVTYNTSTLPGFLTMLQAMRVTIGDTTMPAMYLIYKKAAPETITGTPANPLLKPGTTNTLKAPRRKVKITYNQDINKKIAELEAAIASITAGI